MDFYNSFFASLSSEVAFLLGVAGARLKATYKILKAPFSVIFLFMRLVTLYSHLKRLHRRKVLWLYIWRVLKGFLILFFLVIFTAVAVLLFTGCSSKYSAVSQALPINQDKNYEPAIDANNSRSNFSTDRLDSIVTSFNLKLMRKNLSAINPVYTNSAKSKENTLIAKKTKSNILRLVKDKGLPAALAYHNDSLLQKFELADDSKHDVTLADYAEDIAATNSDTACEMSKGKQCAAVNVLLKGKLHLIRNLKLYLARHNISDVLKKDYDVQSSEKLNRWLSKGKLFFKVYGNFINEDNDYVILDNTKLFKLLSRDFKKNSLIHSFDVSDIVITKIEFMYSKSKLTRLAKSKKNVLLTSNELEEKLMFVVKQTISQLLNLDNLRKTCGSLTKGCFKQKLLFKILPTSKFNIFKKAIKGTIND